jgi:virginiamycin B lyase
MKAGSWTAVLVVATAAAGCNEIWGIREFGPGVQSDAAGSGTSLGEASANDDGPPAEGAPSGQADALQSQAIDAADAGATSDATTPQAPQTDASPEANGAAGDARGDVTSDASEADRAVPQDAAADAIDASVCSSGEHRCSGNAAQTCSGATWNAAVACPSGYCNGAGICGACANGATRCSGSKVQTCTDGQWGAATSCGGAEACSANACGVELTIEAGTVTATQGLLLFGPVAYVVDTSSSAALSATIDWGDGTSPCAAGLSADGSRFRVMSCTSHLYSTTGTPTITVTVNSSTGAMAIVAFKATVRPPPTINLYPAPTGASPNRITGGSDGNLWFTEEEAKIARFNMKQQTIDEFTVPQTPSTWGIVQVPGGDLWFTGQDSSVYRVIMTATAPQIVPYTADNTVCNSGCTFAGIASGSDGNIWFTDIATGNQVGRLTIGGWKFTEYNVPTTSSAPHEIAPGPDGNLWFTEQGRFNIGKIALGPPITISEIGLPTQTVGNVPQGIVAGPDGNVWFTEYANGVGRISPRDGQIIEFAAPAAGNLPRQFEVIALGPDGNLWFTEGSACQIGRITPTGAVTEFAIPPGTPFCELRGITAGPDSQVWFVDLGGRIGSLPP